MQAIEIFFSYAHEDEDLMNIVRRQLIIFEREGIIVKWHDRMILPGQEWEGVIDDRINRAKIILLFISPYFIESKYCYNTEMQVALKRHDRGDATVIPIILRACPWTNSPLGKLQALPKDGKPLNEWGNRDKAGLTVAEGIMVAVQKLRDRPKSRAVTSEETKRQPLKKNSMTK
jgi:TIR domain